MRSQYGHSTLPSPSRVKNTFGWPSAPPPPSQAHTTRLRPDASLDSYTLAGTPEDIHHMIQQYRTAGISKFVLRLACPEAEGLEQLTRLAEAVAVPVNAPA